MATPAPTATGQKKHRKFSYLFYAQVLLVVLFPYLNKPGLPVLLFRLLGAAALVTAVYAVGERRRQWVAALSLAVPAGVLNLIFILRPVPQFGVPGLIFTILFLAYTAVILLRLVLRAQTVTMDTIYGALSVYLLMAFVWGTAYMLLETLQPGALSLDSARHPNQQVNWADCMFYSFVTLTTTGYGDMVPVTAHSRSLSILEAISGTMYLAVLIARLVGMHATPNFEADS